MAKRCLSSKVWISAPGGFASKLLHFNNSTLLSAFLALELVVKPCGPQVYENFDCSFYLFSSNPWLTILYVKFFLFKHLVSVS